VVDPGDARNVRLSLACMNAVLAGKPVERAPPQSRGHARGRRAALEQKEARDQVTADGFLISGAE